MNPSHRPNANVPEPLKLRRFVILDGIGSLCMGLGLAKVFGDVDIIPEVLRSEHYGVALIVLGVSLSVPTMLSMLAQIRRRSAASHRPNQR